MATSRKLVPCKQIPKAIGQLGGHVKMGVKHPVGARTKCPMALVSAVPLAPGSDRMVLAFLDRSHPEDTFDYKPESGDNAVIVAEIKSLGLSMLKGVCPGDWRGLKLDWGEEIEEPLDLDVDPIGLSLKESDAWIDQVDELGVDCTKWGGFPLWVRERLDLEKLCGRPVRFHHRIAGDLIDLGLGDGGVVMVFVYEDESGGCLVWQEAGGGKERHYYHYQTVR